MQETPVQSLGQENPLEEEMATRSSILPWRIPWYIVHGVAESDMTQRLAASFHLETKDTHFLRL